jgi:hypothetical protein
MRKLRERLTYANVVSTLALFLVLGSGTAYATHLVVNSSDVVNDSLTGDDIKEGTLGTVRTATLGGMGRSAATASNCIPPDDGTYLRCVQVQLDLKRPARVLLNGRITALNEGPSNVNTEGSCRWGGVQESGPVEQTVQEAHMEEISLVGLTNVIQPGQGYTFAIECRESPFLVQGVQYIDAWITAVAISPS